MPRTAAAARIVETEWGAPGSPALCFWHELDEPPSNAALQTVGRVLAGDYGLQVRSSRLPDGPLPSTELEVLDRLGLEPTAVMGHGNGGAVACHVAAAAPALVTALVLLEGGHVDEGEVRPSAAYPAIRAAGIPVLLLTATEPPDLAARNEPWIERFRAALPDADVQRMPGWGHDLIADGGPVLAHVIGGWLGEL